MTLDEMIVIVGCLAIGYLVVNRFFVNEPSGPSTKTGPTEPPPAED